jgi:nicotinamide riboside kinase
VPDGLQRESEEVRQRVHAQLVDVLDARRIPFTLLTGELAARMRQVEAVIGPPGA